MGENRPSAVRGDGMDDVIFNGAESRPARNSASVEVLIDNRERLAPAAFNGDDLLEISRRITRAIGSAYTINGKTARARDVQMLFADASTGAHSPALVRQGQIGELINARPKARRRILEEARDGGKVTNQLRDNLREVMNVLATLLCSEATPHVKFRALHLTRADAPADALALAAKPAARLDVNVDLGDYGAVFTTGWERTVAQAGADVKALKQTVNTQWIYPPQGDREALLAACDIDAPWPPV